MLISCLTCADLVGAVALCRRVCWKGTTVAGSVTFRVVEDCPELGVRYLALENFLMAKDVHHECVVHVYASMMRCHEKYVFHIIVEVLT